MDLELPRCKKIDGELDVYRILIGVFERFQNVSHVTHERRVREQPIERQRAVGLG